MEPGHSFKWVFVKKPFPCRVMVHYMRFISIVLENANPRGMLSLLVGRGWFRIFFVGLLIKTMRCKTTYLFRLLLPCQEAKWLEAPRKVMRLSKKGVGRGVGGCITPSLWLSCVFDMWEEFTIQTWGFALTRAICSICAAPGTSQIYR